jgi:hypothetical protein
MRGRAALTENQLKENAMIPNRPIAPLTVGPRKGWKAAVSAVVMAALLGTTATAAVAAESGAESAASRGAGSAIVAAPPVLATEPAGREQ